MIDISFKNKTGLKPEILSAVIGSDSFFYGLFSEDYKLLECQYYAVKDFTDEALIERINFDLYKVDNLRIKVTSTSKPFLHSSTSDSTKLLKFFPAFQNKINSENKFTDQDVIVDYGLTKDQFHFLNSVLKKEFSSFHISTVLSNYYYPFSQKQLLAFVEDEKLHLLYGTFTDFVYYNQFDCKHENDYLYFISLVYDELKLDKNADRIQLFGRVDIDSPIYNLLHGYIRNIEFMKSEKLVISDLRFRMNQHYYLDLYATALCE